MEKVNPFYRPTHEMVDVQPYDGFPCGWRFQPTDEELISSFLQPKLRNEKLTRNRIYPVKFYDIDPETLVGKVKSPREDTWYFFAQRKRLNNFGPGIRNAGDQGKWIATGTDKTIFDHQNNPIGYRTEFTYCKNVGNSKEATTTPWMMVEYRIEKTPPEVKISDGNNKKLKGLVICKVFKSMVGLGKRKRNEEENENTEGNSYTT